MEQRRAGWKVPLCGCSGNQPGSSSGGRRQLPHDQAPSPEELKTHAPARTRTDSRIVKKWGSPGVPELGRGPMRRGRCILQSSARKKGTGQSRLQWGGSREHTQVTEASHASDRSQPRWPQASDRICMSRPEGQARGQSALVPFPLVGAGEGRGSLLRAMRFPF